MLNESFLVTPSIADIHLVETAISDIKLFVVYQSYHPKSTGKYYKQSDRNRLKYGKTTPVFDTTRAVAKIGKTT